MVSKSQSATFEQFSADVLGQSHLCVPMTEPEIISVPSHLLS